MSSLEIDGQLIELDQDGFLLNLADWSETVALALAENEGLVLSDAHFEVIHALRRFHEQYQLSPAMRPL